MKDFFHQAFFQADQFPNPAPSPATKCLKQYNRKISAEKSKMTFLGPGTLEVEVAPV